MPQEAFLAILNLDQERYAKLTVALETSVGAGKGTGRKSTSGT